MKAIDLFSGPGGLSIGMKDAGIDPFVAVEKRRDAIDTYTSHTPDAIHFNEDIRSIDFSRYKATADIIFGGPPCQPFSTGGLRQGHADARNMFPEYIRALREVQPRAFLCENVPGLATKSRLRYLAEILEELEDVGYFVSWNVVSAADYGVPQKRRRLIIVGMKNQYFWFPKPTHGPGTGKDYVRSGSVVSKDMALGAPPDCPVIYAKYPDPRKSPYAGHVYNGGGRPIDLDAPCHTILASAGGYKTHWVDTENVAPDYAAHLMEGGKPREGEVPGARRLTVEESALLQTFPVEMNFAGSRSSQYTQVGDAVPPMLARVLGRSLRDQLEDGCADEKSHFPVETTLPLWPAAAE